MKKHYLGLTSLTIFVAALLVLGPHAYADDLSKVDQLIQASDDQRAQVESDLSIDPTSDKYPWAKSYYDDLEMHWEQGQLMRDVIAQGIN